MNQGYLNVTDGHSLWWCCIREQNTLPVCILHGGPGGSSRLEAAEWFPEKFSKCYMFDQRGCGKSTPLGDTSGNTLNDLIEDIERFRIASGVERWVLCGGSWGALLALRYALAYPARVTGLMFRSPFMGTAAEVQGFFAHMPAWLGSVACQALALEPQQASGLVVLQKLTAMMQGAAADAALAAQLWDAFETDMAGTVPCPHASPRVQQALAKGRASESLLSKFRIQAHYLSEHCFLEQDWPAQLSDAISTIENLPVEIVQGSSDQVCTGYALELLQQHFKQARLCYVPDAGHDMRLPAMQAALMQAGARLLARVQASYGYA